MRLWRTRLWRDMIAPPEVLAPIGRGFGAPLAAPAVTALKPRRKSGLLRLGSLDVARDRSGQV